jgi:cytidylate kinase
MSEAKPPSAKAAASEAGPTSAEAATGEHSLGPSQRTDPREAPAPPEASTPRARGTVRTVAIDGPGGAGKTTLAQGLARALDLPHLDTGAMYRAVALAALRQGVPLDDHDRLAALARAVHLEVDGTQVRLEGEDVSTAIRTPEVDRAVSAVAAVPGVRAELVRRQRAWVAARGGGVLEGRDIGSVVLPDADAKVYLTADAATRVRRRAGERPSASPEAVAKELEARDRLDRAREASPLPDLNEVPPGAIVVDSTDAGAEEVLDRVLAAIEAQSTGRATTPTHSVRAPWAPAVPARLYGAMRAVGRLIDRAYWRLRVHGTEHVPASGPVILAPVHRSFFDFFVVAEATRRPIAFMAKEELWRVRWFGRFLEALGAFPVRRGGIDREALARAEAVLAGSGVLVVFPEGTRRRGPVVEQLHDGAAFLALRSGASIVPVGIAGMEASMPKGARLPRPVPVEIVVGAPLRPELRARRVARRDLMALTERLRLALQAAFDEANARLAARGRARAARGSPPG